MDSTIKVNGLPKNYYRERYYEYASKYNKMKIAKELAEEQLLLEREKTKEYKLECDETWNTMKLQTEYIKELESKLYQYENQGEDEKI